MNRYYKTNLIILITILSSIKTYDIVFFFAINTTLSSFQIDNVDSISNFTNNEIQNTTSIKNFTGSITKSIIFSGEPPFSFSAIAIIIKSDNDKTYHLLTPNSGYYKCENGTSEYISLVEDSIWNNNKKIPNLASVISCNGNVTFTYDINL